MNKKFIRMGVIVFLIGSLVFSSSAITIAAPKTEKKMTVYTDVIKSGNNAYAITGNGIYKINLKDGKKKKIAANDGFPIQSFGCMKLHKGYIYYVSSSSGYGLGYLSRVKTNGKKKKGLDAIEGYAISKNKIYYKKNKGINSAKKGTYVKRQMNLDGTKKKKSSYKVRNTFKKSNVKGYYVKSVSNGNGRYTDYLIRPNKKKLKICTYEGLY